MAKLSNLLGFSRPGQPKFTPFSGADIDDLEFTPEIRKLVRDRFAGRQLGFGPDFVSRATNPTIKKIEARQREVTQPFISSQLSKRGVARSIGPGLASDVTTRAQQSSERDINELLARFQTLNELQKRKEFGANIGLAERQNQQEARLINIQADRNAGVNAFNLETSRRDQIQQELQRKRLGNTIKSAVGIAAAPFTGGASLSLVDVGSDSSTSDLLKLFQQSSGSSSVNIG